MALVLCVGLNSGLLLTRKLILEDAGHVVATASSADEVSAACRDVRFDVAVVTQNGVPESSHAWMAIIRKHCPGISVLEVCSPEIDTPFPDSDALLEAPADPDELIRQVAILASKKRKAAQQPR